MFDKPQGFDLPAGADDTAALFPGFSDLDPEQAPAPAPVKRPRRLSLTNWPVRWKVFAIALVPLVLAAAFGGLRIYASATEARDLRVAADRAALVPAINDYMAALENALASVGGDGQSQAMSDFQTRHSDLQQRLGATDVVSDVRLAVTTLLDHGQDLLNKSGAGALDLRQRVTTFAPLLLTAETAITGSVRVDDEQVRLQAEGLARAVGARGQMTMQRMLVDRGGDLPEPVLRSSMIGLAGTEPSTVMGMSALLGGASEEASALRSQMVQRLSLLADPTVSLVGNEQLLASIQTTDQIAQKVIDGTTTNIIDTVDSEATHQRNTAIRDAILVLAAFLIALAIVWWVARSLTRPLRRLRDGALKIAHQDLASEIERVKGGDEREPDPLPIHTTEEVGQVAHAVDELHTQALLLAGDEARLRVMVNDMFETLSRRNKSLVDQQLSLIDRLERAEEDPDRLDSLFRLDHLATRMRRNGANLLVLAGAQVTREQSQPVPLASLINAAASEVEEYQRVETGMVPDCSLTGATAGDSVHLLAELIDNALRYSPPTSQVRVTAVHTSDAGVLIDINDAGLGMTDGDLRIANMRLNAGGEVSPENTRHMGLFVAGRLARQHGMTVRLLPAASGVGTVAQVYLPPQLLEGFVPVEAPLERPTETPLESAPPAAFYEPEPGFEPEELEAAEASVTLLPRRSPGSSGIAGGRTEQPFGEPDEVEPQGAIEPWWSSADEPAAAQAPGSPANTAGFFSSRKRVRREAVQDQEEPEQTQQLEAPEPEVPEPTAESEAPEPEAPEPEAPEPTEPEESYDTGSIDLSDMNRLAVELAPHTAGSGIDLIYQNMVSEWLVDPHELAVPQDWKSVWDNGWAAAADAERVPVESHTDHGLPVRAPGARLIPGGTPGIDGPGEAEPEAASNGAYPERDPDAIRASMSNHFGGVRAARTHARYTSQGPDDE